MRHSRVLRELAAWCGGAAVGAVAGTVLGSFADVGMGVTVGIVIGLVSALSIRRGRGQSGWADADGESRVGQGSPAVGASPGIPKGTSSPADLPAVPGMGHFHTGSAGPGV